MSIHNRARKGAIAEKVLLPGDPLRAKYIAENFLKNPKQYNDIRGMLGFTGTYNGEKVSVQGTGMGMPSMSIYATELMEEYGCKTLIRIGTCGTTQPFIKLKDVILAQAACTDSGMNHHRFGIENSFAPIADFSLLMNAYQLSQERKLNTHVGNIICSDFFYNDEGGDIFDMWTRYNVLAVEMETAALYTLAAKYSRRALSLLTVSDHITQNKHSSPKERETSFNNMIEIALSVK